MAGENFQQEKKRRGSERDPWSTILQANFIESSLKNNSNIENNLFRELEEHPNTLLSGIKDDIPKHQPNKKNGERGRK